MNVRTTTEKIVQLLIKEGVLKGDISYRLFKDIETIIENERAKSVRGYGD